MGQVSGIAFIFGMDGFKAETTGSMTYPLMVMIGLMIFSFLLSSRLKESKILTGRETVPNLDLQAEAVKTLGTTDNSHVRN